MLQVQVGGWDYFLLYLRYASTLFSTATWNTTTTHTTTIDNNLPSLWVKVSRIPTENGGLGIPLDKMRFKCELFSKAKDNCASDTELGENIAEWYCDSVLASVNNSISFDPVKHEDRGDVHIAQVDFGLDRDHIRNTSFPICCRILAKRTNETVGQDCLVVQLEGSNKLEDVQKKKFPLPTNFHAGLIQSRSVVISWLAPKDVGENVLQHYILEYKVVKAEWKNATKLVVNGSQTGVLVEDLSPWTMYHFRLLSVYNIGTSFPELSPVIVVVTAEDLPSGAPSNVKILDNQTLLVSWKPLPRSTCNGALLGYKIGYKRITTSSSSEDDEEGEEVEKDNFSFMVLTSTDLMGKPCQYTISVPDTRNAYGIVVQAFNNIGAGPVSQQVITG